MLKQGASASNPVQQAAEAIKQEGNHLAGLGKYAEALAKYNEALRVDPALESAWLNKGLMQKKLHQFSEARKSFRQALKINPRYQKASANLYAIYHAILRDTPDNLKVLLEKQRYEQVRAAKVIFACVDLKLTPDGRVKILEFGPGVFSGFSGFTMVTGQDFDPIRNQAIKRATTLPLHLIVQHGRAHAQMNNDDSKEFFATLPTPPGDFFPEKLASYKAIYGGCVLRPVTSEERVLLLDDYQADAFFADKQLTHEAFVKSDQLVARPMTAEFKRLYTPSLAKEINAAFKGAKHVVLKAVDVEGGKGVMILKNNVDQLDVALQFLLSDGAHVSCEKMLKILQCPEEELKDYRQSWQTSHRPDFLVEELVHGKLIKDRAKQSYDPTMRVAFVVTRDDGILSCQPFAAYWKLPPKPVTQGSLRERIVSSFGNGHFNALPVSESDQAIVYQQLQAVLPAVFSYMLNTDLHKRLSAYPEITTIEKTQKIKRYVTAGNAFALIGKYQLALYYLGTAQKLAPHDFSKSEVSREIGIYFALQGDYKTAIDLYARVLQLNHSWPDIHYLRGIAYKHLGEFEKAEEDFKIASQLWPAYYAAKVEWERLEIETLKDSQKEFGRKFSASC